MVYIINDVFVKKSAKGKSESYANCTCYCGQAFSGRLAEIKSGRLMSCGCYHRQLMGRIKRTHGATVGKKTSKTYKSWTSMKYRCHNPKSISYPNYGGKGIEVCDRWLKSFGNFLRDMGERPEGSSLERIDRMGNYSPNNCKWASRKEQSNNTKRNIRIEIDGVSKNVTEWAEHLGVSSKTIFTRLARNWTARDAVLTPVRAFSS